MADYCVFHMCKHDRCKYYIYCKAFREKYRKLPASSAVGGYWCVGDYAYDKNEKLIELFMKQVLVMIMINGNWEQVKDLSDVLRIVSENIGEEFAQKVEEILENYEYIGDE